MDTVHDMDKEIEDFKKSSSFIPPHLIDEALKDVRKKPFIETVMYAVVNREDGNKDVIALMTNNRDQNPRNQIKVLMDDADNDDAYVSVKMNELRLLHDPDWKGNKQEPLLIEENNYDDFLHSLEQAGKGEQVRNLLKNQGQGTNPFRNSVNIAGTIDDSDIPDDIKEKAKALAEEIGKTLKGMGLNVDAEVGSITRNRPMIFGGKPRGIKGMKKIEVKHDSDAPKVKSLTELTAEAMKKDGKIPVELRKQLVKKYGEANIKDLEGRVARQLGKKTKN